MRGKYCKEKAARSQPWLLKLKRIHIIDGKNGSSVCRVKKIRLLSWSLSRKEASVSSKERIRINLA